MIFQDTSHDTPQDTSHDIYKRLERLERNIKVPMYVSKKYITRRETPKALKAPKIWKICLEELYCDYFYTTISYQTLLNKMWIPKISTKLSQFTIILKEIRKCLCFKNMRISISKSFRK